MYDIGISANEIPPNSSNERAALYKNHYKAYKNKRQRIFSKALLKPYETMTIVIRFVEGVYSLVNFVLK